MLHKGTCKVCKHCCVVLASSLSCLLRDRVGHASQAREVCFYFEPDACLVLFVCLFCFFFSVVFFFSGRMSLSSTLSAVMGFTKRREHHTAEPRPK